MPRIVSHNRLLEHHVLVATIAMVLPGVAPFSVTGQGFAPKVQACATCQSCEAPCRGIASYGWGGQPWHDREPGGCNCSNRIGATFSSFSAHWASPFSALIDHEIQGDRFRRTADTTHARPRDVLDGLATVRLLPPVRRDNGYCGCGCDPWGLPGASGQFHLTAPEHFAPPAPETDPGSETAPEAPAPPLPAIGAGPVSLLLHNESLGPSSALPMTNPVSRLRVPAVATDRESFNAARDAAPQPGLQPLSSGVVWESQVASSENSQRVANEPNETGFAGQPRPDRQTLFR